MKALGEALQAFLTSETMSPFTSKFDDYLRGKAQLSPLEMKGLAAFENRAKGACNHCHLMYEHSNRPDSSLFTTYSYDAVGVPRNRAIAANADAKRYDLGLCERTQKKVPFVGREMVRLVSNPVASQRGGSPAVHAQRRVLEASRRRGLLCDALDEPRALVSRTAPRSTTCPVAIRGNVNHVSLPYNRREGDPPAIDDADIDAIVAFLQTLTDEPYRSRLSSEQRAAGDAPSAAGVGP